MAKVVLIAAVTVTALAMTSSAAAMSPDRMIQKGATGLTWLTNPQHARMGTTRSRARATRRNLRLLYTGLSQVGWLRSALCVHHFEGTWDDTRNPVDDGGMQMDQSFQQSYGPVFYQRWGRAYHWPVWAQLYTAYQGWKVRGWYPWPNTARYCGLI